MYLLINDTRHTVSRRIVTKDTIKYLSVTPAVENISGTAKLYRDDGFFMAEDDLDRFERKSYVGTLLTVTNEPDPPAPPEPQISDDEAVAIITDTLTNSEALNIITGGTT